MPFHSGSVNCASEFRHFIGRHELRVVFLGQDRAHRDHRVPVVEHHIGRQTRYVLAVVDRDHRLCDVLVADVEHDVGAGRLTGANFLHDLILERRAVGHGRILDLQIDVVFFVDLVLRAFRALGAAVDVGPRNVERPFLCGGFDEFGHVRRLGRMRRILREHRRRKQRCQEREHGCGSNAKHRSTSH